MKQLGGHWNNARVGTGMEHYLGSENRKKW
jgi:hypothetical protein